MYAPWLNFIHDVWAPCPGGISLHTLLGSLVYPREPVSTWTHELGALVSVPAGVTLWRAARGGLGKRVSLLVFGMSLAVCFAGSVACHAYRGTATQVATLSVADHVGIHVLLAGTCTPLAWSVMAGAARRRALGAVWLVAGCGALLHVACGDVPTGPATAVHLTAGVMLAAMFPRFTSGLPPRERSLFLTGCGLYVLGGVLNALHWPDPWPGAVGPHECFHVFVLAGSLAHFRLFQGIAATPEACRPGPTSAITPGPGSIGLPTVPFGVLGRSPFITRPDLLTDRPVAPCETPSYRTRGIHGLDPIGSMRPVVGSR